MSRHGIAFLFAIVMASFAQPAHAVPITYSLTLNANVDNETYVDPETEIIFGEKEISGPFYGTLTLDFPVLPGNAPTVTAFSLTVGTQTWDMSDNPDVAANADAAGNLLGLVLSVDADGNPGLPRETYFVLFSGLINIEDFWQARDGDCANPLTVLQGACIEGRGSSGVSITRVDEAAPVPEPATLMLTSLGLAAVAARRRRSGRQ